MTQLGGTKNTSSSVTVTLTLYNFQKSGIALSATLPLRKIKKALHSVYRSKKRMTTFTVICLSKFVHSTDNLIVLQVQVA